MNEEIVQSLTNLNIDGDTAKELMSQYLRYQYVKLVSIIVVAVPLVWIVIRFGIAIMEDEFKK